MRRSIALAVLLLAALSPATSRAAATTRSIDVVSGAFDPSAAVAKAGDTVVWNFKAGGLDPQNTDRGVAHTVTAYSGATFDSGPMQANQTFSVPNWPGGRVLYRCRIHSTLDSNNKCTGMCGVVTDSPPPLPAPAIQNPASGANLSSNDVPLIIAVNGDGMIGVRLQDQSGSGPPVTIASYDLKDGDTYDTFVSTTLHLPNGSHTLRALSKQADGFETPLSDPISFIVSGQDTQAPRIALSAPVPQNSGLPAIVSNPVFINGSASDDVGVVQVSLEILSAAPGSKPVFSVFPCDDPCNRKTQPFSGNVILPAGRYTLTVRAYDAIATGTLDAQTKAAHTGTVTRDVLVLM